MWRVRLALSVLVPLSTLSALVTFSTLSPVGAAAGVADRWWTHVTFLADDRLAGRDTGSDGHRQAAEYVASQFERAGLRPGAGDTYFQRVAFTQRRIVEDRSSLALVRGGRVEPIVLGDEATFNMRIDQAPSVEAPLVFIGYGLTIPEIGHDDRAGLDLQGKVAVLFAGAPPNAPASLLAHYQSVRWSLLRETGAVGVMSITNPRSMDIPWERSAPARLLPSLTLADATLDETAGQQLAVTINPARAEKLFAGSGHTFQEILSAAEQGRALPRFALPSGLRATVAVTTARIESPNVVGVLPGIDPRLAGEYVVLSAHLDHVGVGQPINGDPVFNGAMDNAAGIATLVETAAAINDAGLGFKRSLVFLAVTAEEKGLLGSRAYAGHPPLAPGGAIVANLNTDMFLPLFPLRSVIALGLEESDLAGDLRAVAAPLGVRVLPDPEPERNSFVRSDQYSFIRRGIPALALKVGFDRDSPEHEIVRRWRAERYHAPSDDLSQPIDAQAAADFNRLYLRLVETVANRNDRPAWNADSFFRRFVPADDASR